MDLCILFIMQILTKLGLIKILYTSKQLREVENEIFIKLNNALICAKLKKVVLIWIKEGAKYTFENIEKKIDVFREKLGLNIVLIASVTASSYGNGTEGGEMRFEGLCKEDEMKIIGSHVIVIDDLTESRGTALSAENYFHKLKAAKVTSIVSFHKITGKKQLPISNLIHGAEIQSCLFFVGYGLDFYDELRDLDFVIGVKKWFFEIFKYKCLRGLFVSLIRRYEKTDE